MSVTYEEMNDARGEFQEARTKFSLKYHDFLTTAIENAGFLNKIVQIKDTGVRGQFKVSSNISTRQPWEIKFHPLTKSGEVSMKSKYLHNFYSWKEDELTEQMLKIAEVVSNS